MLKFFKKKYKFFAIEIKTLVTKEMKMKIKLKKLEKYTLDDENPNEHLFFDLTLI